MEVRGLFPLTGAGTSGTLIVGSVHGKHNTFCDFGVNRMKWKNMISPVLSVLVLVLMALWGVGIVSNEEHTP